MQEVSYNISIELSTVLHKNKKSPWPTLIMQIILYEIKNLKVADTEGKEIEKFAFGNLEFNPYDPRNVCKDHCARIHYQ